MKTIREILPDVHVREPIVTRFSRHLCINQDEICAPCTHQENKEELNQAFKIMRERLIDNLNSLQDQIKYRPGDLPLRKQEVLDKAPWRAEDKRKRGEGSGSSGSNIYKEIEDEVSEETQCPVVGGSASSSSKGPIIATEEAETEVGYDWAKEKAIIDSTIGIDLESDEMEKVFHAVMNVFRGSKTRQIPDTKEESLEKIKEVAKSHKLTAEMILDFSLSVIKPVERGTGKRDKIKKRRTSEEEAKEEEQEEEKDQERLEETPIPPEPNPEAAREHRYRNPDIEQYIADTEPNGEFIEEFDPTKTPATDLDKLFTDREEEACERGLTSFTRNFITYISRPGEEKFAAQYKIRVNCKYEPKDTTVTYPEYMKNYAKTTLVRIRYINEWIVHQDRAWANETTYYDDWEDDYDRMCVFLQKPRYTRTGYAYLSRFVLLDDDKDKVGTLGKKQRELINEGIDLINKQDDCMRRCLKAQVPTKKSFLGKFAKV